MGLCIGQGRFWKKKKEEKKEREPRNAQGSGERRGGREACAPRKRRGGTRRVVEQKDASPLGGVALRAGAAGANGITRSNEGVGPIWLDLTRPSLFPSGPIPGRGGEDEPVPGGLLKPGSCPETFLLALVISVEDMLLVGHTPSLFSPTAARCSLRMSCNMSQPSSIL